MNVGHKPRGISSGWDIITLRKHSYFHVLSVAMAPQNVNIHRYFEIIVLLRPTT